MTPYDDAELVAVLPVADLDRSEAFYGRLGFTVLASHHDYRILEAGGAHVHLVHNPDAQSAESRSGVYLYLASAEMANHTHAAWEAAGVHILTEPADRPYGLREFAAEDPDGNLWRVGGLLDAGDGQSDADRSANDEADPSNRVQGGGVAPGAEAPNDGSLGTDDNAWLSIVAQQRCEGCGLTASDGSVSGLAGRLRDAAYSWSSLLTSADDDAVRTRRQPQEWSALEYGVHTRDVIAVFNDRIHRALVETNPDLGW
ncbi:MAG: VOC family protein, partial [Aquihabitans sp.]